MKILITSVGSVVGKNILDVLEYPGYSRRHLARVVGLNSVADSPNNFRCDRCYLVPPTAAADYGARMRAILREEAPDLIVCGRDEDTLALAELKARHPDLPGALPVGNAHTALIGLDKWETWRFALRHDLPSAESFLPGRADAGETLEAFCERVGYPLVAKPVRGFASRGVHFLRDARDARAMAQREGVLIQEYLGDARALASYFELLQGPPPLFARCADEGYYSCQTVIAPNGDLAPVLVTHNPAELGVSPRLTRVEDPALEALTMAYARALASEGALGPVNVQYRRDRGGRWKAVEINLRHTGATLARFILGMDELYLIARDFVPGASFPKMDPGERDRAERVGKHQATYQLFPSAIATLGEAGVWSNKMI